MQQQAQQGGQAGSQQSQMTQGGQSMQQQLQQLQAAQQDAQQVAAAQQATAQAMQNQANAMNGGACDNPGQGNNPQGAGATGEWKAGDPNNRQGNGMGGPGQGNGGHAQKEQAPAGFKPEIDPSQDNEKGKILASTFVKSDALKGDSKIELGQIIQSAQKDSTDEVDQEHVSRQQQSVVEEYFRTIEKDAK
jgi:ribosomal protein L16/L10AE